MPAKCRNLGQNSHGNDTHARNSNHVSRTVTHKAREESAPVTERRKKTRETPHTKSVFLYTVSSVYPST